MIPRVAEAVIDCVCETTMVSRRRLTSTDRSREVIVARQLAACVLRDLGFSFPAIGGYLHRDHSTILRAVERSAENYATYPLFGQLRERIRHHSTVLSAIRKERKASSDAASAEDVHISTGSTATEPLESESNPAEEPVDNTDRGSET